ncbi:antirestriction protein, partial [Providencia rettgeri]
RFISTSYFKGECIPLSKCPHLLKHNSAQEAGIIVTLMMLSHFSFVTYEKEHHEDCERISAYFHQLRDFIFTLSPESQTKILNAID